MATGVRPGGFSSIRETSRSPNTVSSSVRGIGVADMASRCAASPLACSRARSPTPNRCCSSITVRARAWKATSSWKSAWVPTATAAEPPASAASFSAPAGALVAAGQQDGLHPVAGQRPGQRLEVLAGQDLGGRHQRRLQAGRGDVGHRQHRHHRLAGADVALHEPAHPLAGRQVARGSRLRVRTCAPVSRKGRSASTLVSQRAGGDRRRRLALAGGLALGQRQLVGEAARRRRAAGAPAPAVRGPPRPAGCAAPPARSRQAGQRCCCSQAASCHSGSAGARASASSAKRRTPREGRPAVAG